MKCLEIEKLISYACHMADEPAASQVRAHLGECPRCREIAQQHSRLDAVLGEWKAAEPTPGFDARVWQAVEAQQANSKAWSFRSWGWARGLALASLGGLIIAGVVWITQSHLRVSNSSAVATRQSQSVGGAQTPVQVAQLPSPNATPPTGMNPSQTAPDVSLEAASRNEDKDTQALEDYDLAANFDLLSELPKREPRVAN